MTAPTATDGGIPLPTSSMGTRRRSGDYCVLNNGVEEQRNSVRQSRAALASALDRLGEHHVRQKEYDDAMDAFTEALHEKRSIYANVLSTARGGCSSSTGASPEDSSSSASSDMEGPQIHDQAIDEIICTLRNLGNVHSLRGEQDEAMRYFTEVTNLRATKSACKVDMGDDTTLFSGLGGGEEDNSTLMSEINEDVKALDDMFRSISFRSRDSSSLWKSSRQSSKPLAPSLENTSTPGCKRRKSESSNGHIVGLEASEPFRRSTSLGFPATGNELAEALELYKSVLETYKGSNLEQHKETFNSLALRVDLLAENMKQPESPSSSSQGCAIDLELAVEIYQSVLSAQQEIDAFQDPALNPQKSANVASTLIRMGSLYYKLGNRLEELRMYQEAKKSLLRGLWRESYVCRGDEEEHWDGSC